MPDELLTIDQVATELQLHPDTIRRYIKKKQLKSIKLGGSAVRIKRSELDKFIQESEQNTES